VTTLGWPAFFHALLEDLSRLAGELQERHGGNVEAALLELRAIRKGVRAGADERDRKPEKE
jgi:hypothetical protein